MNKQEQLAEIQLIRTALNKVAMNYCQTQEESKAIKDISLRLGNTETILLAEVLSDKSNDIQVVDLGLTSGTLWTDRNIGASSPEDAGDYFRFGETTPYTYNSPYEYEDIEGEISGTDRDAATAILGKEYQMPTRLQMKELMDECTLEWTVLNGVVGVNVFGPNGNFIFMPAAGCRIYYRNSILGVGEKGAYWSASPYGNNRSRYMVFANGVNRDYWKIQSDNRGYAISIRAVKVL